MSKYIEAIKRYEKARKAVSTLAEKKRALVSDCDNLKEQEGEDWTHVIHRKPCLVVAWDFMQRENEGGDVYGYGTYEGALNSDDIGTVSGVVCDKCFEASAMKQGALSKAKKEFGAAKRSLSAIGKKLIGEEMGVEK